MFKWLIPLFISATTNASEFIVTDVKRASSFRYFVNGYIDGTNRRYHSLFIGRSCDTIIGDSITVNELVYRNDSGPYQRERISHDGLWYSISNPHAICKGNE